MSSRGTATQQALSCQCIWCSRVHPSCCRGELLLSMPCPASVSGVLEFTLHVVRGTATQQALSCQCIWCSRVHPSCCRGELLLILPRQLGKFPFPSLMFNCLELFYVCCTRVKQAFHPHPRTTSSVLSTRLADRAQYWTRIDPRLDFPRSMTGKQI